MADSTVVPSSSLFSVLNSSGIVPDETLSPIEARAAEDAKSLSEDKIVVEPAKAPAAKKRGPPKPKPKPKPSDEPIIINGNENGEEEEKQSPPKKIKKTPPVPKPKPKKTTAPKPKPKKPVDGGANDDDEDADEDEDEEESSSSLAAEPTRHAPGYSLLRVERDRIDRALLSLRRKADNRMSASGGKKVQTTVCSILNDALIEFFTDEKNRFEAKFGRYLAN